MSPKQKPLRLVVLDDDPTGIQTVHGCYVLTDWKPATLEIALKDRHRFFYVLTNTRAVSRERAERIIHSVMTNLLKANRWLHFPLMFVSRSDSTLRNHFPAEIEVVVRHLERKGQGRVDAIFLVPAFLECGRVTLGNTHYLLEGKRRVPVSETEFARDSVFDYRSAVLPEYIEEKTGGAVRAEAVRSIPLALLRNPGVSALDEFLRELRDRTYVVVNAENYADLNCFAQAVLRQRARGKRFVFQSAGSLVKALTGVPNRPLLGREIVRLKRPGLIVVGSHVRKTTAQLQRLLQCAGTEGIEVTVETVLRSGEKLRRKITDQIRRAWAQGQTPVIFTSRSELRFESKEARLRAGKNISHFLSALVRGLSVHPAFLISKGGITSHDILVRGLGVQKARVLGQLLPGVPVIRTPRESRLPQMPYVIFPGNVGDEGALARAFKILTDHSI